MSPSSTAHDAPPPIVPGCEVGELLGAGGFGAVYRGTLRATGEHVAIKVSHGGDPVGEARLEREGAAIESVGPPWVPRFHHFGRSHECAYLVMELIEMPALDAVITDVNDRGVSIGARMFGAIARPLLEALSHLHRQSMVHRDLKPENLFVDVEAGTARIIDLGMVRPNRRVNGDITLTPQGAAIGTPDYMPPEQCLGVGEIDHRADIYAMGLIFYELVTGRLPFVGLSADIKEAHLSRRPAPPSAFADVPEAIDKLVLRCLAKRAEDRFDGVPALLETLDRALEDAADAVFVRKPHSTTVTDGGKGGTRASRRMALVFMTGVQQKQLLDMSAVLGATVVHVEGSRAVVALGQHLGEAPDRRAAQAAEAMHRAGVCQRARLKMASVTVKARSKGRTRYFSALFRQENLYPALTDPPGVQVPREVARGLGAMGVSELPDRTDLVRVQSLVNATSATSHESVVQEIPYVGQKELIDDIGRHLLGSANEGRPSIGVVSGKVGYGKSRLLAELGKIAREQGIQAACFQAPPPLGGHSYALIAGLLRYLFGLPAADPGDGGQAAISERIGPELAEGLWPAVATALEWLPHDSPQAAALRVAPGALQGALVQAVGEGLIAQASKQPLWLFLDDLHQADDAVLKSLEYATVGERSVPLAVLATARPQFASANPTFGDRARNRGYWTLSALADEPAAALCRALLRPAQNVSANAVQKLVARTNGVPMLLVELVDGLRRNGLIRRQTRGGGWYLATDELARLPDLPVVQWLAERELGQLSDELAMHARLVALLDRGATVPALAGVLAILDRMGAGEAVPLDARVGVDRLIDRGLLKTESDGALRFRSGLVRDALQESTPEAVKRSAHEAAYLFFAGVSGEADTEDERRMAQIARHGLCAGKAADVAPVLQRLGDLAKARHDYLTAEERFTQALDALPDSALKARLEARWGRGWMRYRQGRHDDAIADLQVAQALARQLGASDVEAELLLAEATALDWSNEYRASEARVEQAAALVGPGAPQHTRAALQMALGRSAWRFCRLDEAERLLVHATNLSQGLGPSAYEVRIAALLMLSFIYSTTAPERAEPVFDEALTLTRNHHDAFHEVCALNNRCQLWFHRKRVDLAIDDLSTSVAVSRRMGLLMNEYFGCYNLAEVHNWRGDAGRAREHVETAVAIERERLGAESRPVASVLQARIEVFAGNIADAKRLAADIKHHQARHREAGRSDPLLLPNEQVLFESVQLSLEPAASADWDALVARAREHSVGGELVEVLELRARALLRHGALADAQMAVEAALAAAAETPHLLDERLKQVQADLSSRRAAVA